MLFASTVQHLFDTFLIIHYTNVVFTGIKKITNVFLPGAVLLILSSLFLQPLYAEENQPPFFTLQAGVSKDLTSTEKEAKSLAKHSYAVYVVKKDAAGYRIWLGRFKTKDEALSAKKILAARGVQTLLKENEKGPFEHEKSYEAEKPAVKPETKTETKTTPVSEKSTTKNTTDAQTLSSASPNAVLQAGIYKTKSAADKAKEKILNAGYFPYIVVVKQGKRVFYSVRVGESGTLTKEELAQRMRAMKFNVEWVK